MNEQYNTLDELWIEYEKAIKYGNFTEFKTKKGMIGYLNRIAKKTKPTGRHLKLSITFSPEPGRYKHIAIKIPLNRKLGKFSSMDEKQ